jgi:uncharacterized membrane protein YfcA
MSGGMAVFLVLAVVFVSTLVRSTLGFGNALLAMPLLTLLIGVRQASPLVALLGLVVSLLMLLKGWKSVRWREIVVLLLASLPGILLGLVLLTAAPERIVRWILGLVLVGFGLYSILGIRLPTIEAGWLAVPFGLLAGVLGGAYNTNGPPIIIYGVFRGWDKDQFRASLQGFFLISHLLIAAGHGASGLWTDQVLFLFLAAVIPAAAAVYFGERIASGIPQDKFDQLVYAFLVVMGLVMFL